MTEDWSGQFLSIDRPCFLISLLDNCLGLFKFLHFRLLYFFLCSSIFLGFFFECGDFLVFIELRHRLPLFFCFFSSFL